MEECYLVGKGCHPVRQAVVSLEKLSSCLRSCYLIREAVVLSHLIGEAVVSLEKLSYRAISLEKLAVTWRSVVSLENLPSGQRNLPGDTFSTCRHCCP